jgi:hypothetical protein
LDSDFARNFLLWCTTLNYGILLVWFIVFTYAHDLVYAIHTRWFHLSTDQFDAIHYSGMAIYKIGILIFNLVPLFVLYSLS